MILPIRISKLSDSMCFQHKVLHQHNYDEVDMENVRKTVQSGYTCIDELVLQSFQDKLYFKFMKHIIH